jgi:saccharopine dehydrogenase (NAD+, L-lysine-forming)
MSKVLIIGAGGVGGVVAHKCAMNSHVFTEIMLASRTKSKCDKIAADIREMHGVSIQTASVDADIVAEMVVLIKSFQPKMVINVALALPRPYHHGGVFGNGRTLLGHGQLRAQRRGQI